MIRAIAGILAGFVAWVVVATLGNLVLRAALPGYAEVERAMNFTVIMLVARLLVGIISSITACFIVARIADTTYRDVLILSALLLVLFVPVHVSMWPRFPIWYHVAFLLSLVLAPAIVAWGGSGLFDGRREGRA